MRFICMAIKPVHLVVTDLTDYTLISALTQFDSRLGFLAHLFSDFGGNFIGSLLIMQIKYHFTAGHQSGLTYFIAAKGIHSNFNVQAGLHFG